MGGRRGLGNRLAVPAENFSRTLLDDLPAPRLAFKHLGHHLAKLAQPLTATLPQAQGAGSTIRSTGRLSGRARRGGRGFAHASTWRLLVPRSALVSRPGSLPRSSMASSSCSTSSLPRSEDCPNCSRRALASISFSRSISRRPTVTSLLASVSCSRCARIIACAAARSAGSGSEDIVTPTNQSYSPLKIPPDFLRESKSHSLTGSLPDARFMASASQFRTEDRMVAQR